MVKKLFKHEFAAYFQIMLPMHLILVALAFFGRMIQIVETDSILYRIGMGSSVAIFILGIIALFLITQIFAIVRFYKNLFTGEGYLTLTLPVTATQHIWTKVSTVVLMQALNILIVGLSVLLFTAGETFVEIVNEIQEAVSVLYEEAGNHLIGYAVEITVMLILSGFSTNLLYYSCIALGQTFRKNRVLAAVGMYFAYCVIMRLFETILNVVLFASIGSEWIENVVNYLTEHAFASLHTIYGFAIFVSIVMCIVFFMIPRHVMTKKLNLE